MKKKISVFLIAVGAVLITGCSADKSTEQPKDGTELQEEMEAQDEIIKTKINEIEESLLVSEQSGFTDTVPDEYREKASKQGKVTQLDYFSKDYLNGEAETEKTAYVYTPAGYDEKDKGTKYDIIYLLHGWGGNAEDHFKKESTKNIIDNMIERGDIPPVIIVTPTLYTENSKKDFAGSLKEAKVFYRDFEENLMPEVETRFNTYAESTSQKGLEDSRDHRIFGGFSLGSVATWQILCNDFDYVSGYLPMSGACLYYGSFTDVQTEKNVDVIEQTVKEKNTDDKDYYIYFTTGTQDFIKSQSLLQAKEMLDRDQVFTSEHFCFYRKKDGLHDREAVEEYLYNGLPRFFR